MGPLYLETLLLGIVRQTLVAGLCVEVRGIERAGVFVAFLVVAGGGQAPRAFGVYLTEKFQVHLVADGEIVSSVAQIESAGALVAVCRHYES